MTRRELILLPLACAPAVAQVPSAAARAKNAVDAAVAALGGNRFLAMEDRVETGRAYSFYRENLSGLAHARIYTRYLTRPEPPVAGFLGVRERQSFGAKNEESAVLFNENGAWEVSFRGARPLADERLRNYRDSTLRNVFYILRQRLGEPGLSMLSLGSDIYENQPVEIVEIGDAENRTVTVYFSQSTKLPVRQMFQRRNPLTKERDDEVTRFSKYRDVGGGVMWPLQIVRERNGGKIFELYSESVQINQNLTDSYFTLAGSMKILKKDK